MFARIRAVVVLGLVYHATCGPVFEGNPFLQVLTTSKQPLPTPNQKANQTDLYVILPFSGQQLQQSPAVQTSAASSPAPTNHVHSFDCSNPTSSLHVHSQNPILSVQQLSNSNSESAGAAQTVVNANTPELNRRCLKSTGLFLGTSCNKFVSCLNGTATELSCPEGLVFNSEGLYCDRPENVQCNGRTSAATAQQTDTLSRPSSVGSPIHASLVQLTAVPPQQVGQTAQEQQLQQHLLQQVSQSTGNSNSVVQSFATSTPAASLAEVSTLQPSQALLSGVQQNYQQQQHNKQQYQQEQQQHQQQHQQHYQQQHQEQQYQQQSHQQHQEQQYQQQSHQHQQHQQQYYQQQHYQQQHHQQQHQHEQHQQQQNDQYQNHQEQQQHHHQQQQQHYQHQNQLHLSGIQHHQENQQKGSQSAANGNLLVQTPISGQQNVLIGFPEINTVSSFDTNEIGSGSSTRCVTLRGQFPSDTCHTFLNCWGGVATEQACPDGLLFSTKGYCDYPENVNCAGRLLAASQPIVAAPVEIKSPPPPPPPTPSFTPTTNPTVAVIPTTLSTPTATPLPTVVAPELKNKCLSARGQFPSISCNKFVNCWDNIILEQECPEGFLFSARGYCDFSQNVQCGDRPVESKGAVSSSKSECPLDNGTFRDRKRCSSYFTCAADKVVARYECPEGLNFNDYLGVCDFSYRVDCSKDPLVIPGRSNTNIVAQLRRGDECPADFATYRDANNCGVYYTCVSKTIVATYQCPAGFSFNDEIGICDYAERVDCSKSPKIFQVPKNVLPQVTNDIKQKIETCTPGTMFSLNPQCTAVCLCRNGVAEIVQCPAGLAYDSKMDKCILPHLAKC